MFRLRWVKEAVNELATFWLQADSDLRQRITAAAHQIDQQLRTDPFAQSEFRPGGLRILFVSPLGIHFRVEADGRTVSVLRVWLFRKRGQQ
jgi:hypothetical protein